MAMSPRLLRPLAGVEPRQIANLGGWWDAADEATLYQNSDGTTAAVATSDPVGYWRDKSGNGLHAVQSIANNRPIIATTTQNGKRQLSFDGSNDSLTVSTQWANAPFTLFATVARTNTILFPCIFGESSGTNNGYLACGFTQVLTPTSNGQVAISRTGQATQASNLVPGNNVFRLVAYASDGISGGTVSVNARMDGVAASSVLTLSSMLTAASASIGASKGGTADFLLGRIGEVLLFRRKLTAAEIARIERYLALKWGITI